MAEIISLVDLAPPGFDWHDLQNEPQPNETVQQAKARLLLELKKLPPDLRTHLLEHMQKPEDWQMYPESAAEYEPGLSFGNLFNVVPRYRQIREWQENLRSIARHERYIRMTALGTIDWNRGTVDYAKNRFASAIDEEDLRYIRECTICRRIYFAGRLFYKGKEIEPYCGPKCGKKVRAKRAKPKPPPKLAQIEDAIRKLCKANHWKEFDRTKPEKLELLSEWADATPNQCKKALDYRERNPRETKRATPAPKR